MHSENIINMSILEQWIQPFYRADVYEIHLKKSVTRVTQTPCFHAPSHIHTADTLLSHSTIEIKQTMYLIINRENLLNKEKSNGLKVKKSDNSVKFILSAGHYVWVAADFPDLGLGHPWLVLQLRPGIVLPPILEEIHQYDSLVIFFCLLNNLKPHIEPFSN